MVWCGQQQQHRTGVPGRPRPAWVSAKEELSASVRRDKVAKEMWPRCQQCLEERGLVPGVRLGDVEYVDKTPTYDIGSKKQAKHGYRASVRKCSEG